MCIIQVSWDTVLFELVSYTWMCLEMGGHSDKGGTVEG